MSDSSIKKINASQLKVGMYVHDLNCEWLSHPFLRNRFLVTRYEDIQKILSIGIQDIYIDTTRGLNVKNAPTRQEVEDSIEEEIIALASEKTHAPIRVPLKAEWPEAKSIRQHAQKQIGTIMQDVRLGKAVEMGTVTPVVQNISESVLRNSGAMVCLMRIKDKDNYTYLHSVSVCALMIAFCRSLDMPEETITQAGIGGLLHDAGKARMPLKILNKEGRLTENEFRIMKNHPAEGHKLLQQISGIGPIPLDIVLHHHERHDGSGYPNSLNDEENSQIAQMAAIVDVYDAITSDRVYHKAVSAAEGLRRIYEWSRHHFNPQLVHAFIRCIGIYPVGTLVMMESGRLGVVVESNETSLLTPKVKVFFDTQTHSYIAPEEIDLGRPLGSGGGDRIVSHESHEKWQFNPNIILDFT